jgi:hypothetical protein
MAKESKQKNLSDLKYRRVEVADLDKGRKGKHHDLVQGILRELEMLSEGAAMEIPLADVGGIGLANLRSAVHRASTAQGIEIQTLADDKNFYVWKAAKSQDSSAG